MQRIKQIWAALQELLQQLSKLQKSLQQLHVQLKGLTKTIHALQRSVQRYTFKNQPYLAKLNQLLKK